MNIVFAGTPDFAASVLQALLDSPHNVVACYTQPDRPAGRGRKLAASPVKNLAAEQGIDVYQPLNFKADEDLAALKTLNADIMVVVAYGIILPQTVLDTPRLGCINVHASLLPRWRGAAPIQRAIAEGDTETGVTIMQMDKGLDTGDMLSKVSTPISATDNGGSLHDRLASIGAQACVDTLADLSAGNANATPQDNAHANYAHKLSKQEGQIQWQQDSHTINDLIRAFNPWPVAHTEMDGKKIRIFDASAISDIKGEPGTIVAADKDGLVVAAKTGGIRITRMQLSGAKQLPVADILNSRKDQFSIGKKFI
ncbi:methionyl-tRNA formyltransferase [Gammaproteobacteria bacterium 45_16_T64]|nr:methionyl-tRNA formyltransferase [Gammaproteobacteria bacterium 45_16_T64]